MKKTQKQILLLLLCMAFALSCAACGISPGPPIVSPAPTAEPGPSELPAASPAPAAPEETGSEALIPTEDEPEEPSADTPAVSDNPYDAPTPAARAAALGLPEPPDVDITSYEFIVANSHNSITEYRPNYGSFDGIEFDLRASDAAAAFTAAIREAGYGVIARRGYIGYEVQLELNYIPKVWELGAEDAAKLVCGPGCSDHQTAFAFDAVISRDGYADDYADFSQTEAYQWMLAHCAEYGFILRFPEGKESWYGTPCNYKGHFRYVGIEAATYIMENNLCLEEFMLIMDPTSIFVPGVN